MTIEETLTERPMAPPALIAAVMLLGALASWPYGYFLLLRWVVTAAAIILAVFGYSTRRVWAAWVFGFVAIIFNPILPVYLTRDSWKPIDIGTSVLFLIGASALTNVSADEGGTK